MMTAEAGAPAPIFRPFPEEHKSIDIGSYSTDTARIRRELGWEPKVRFPEGIQRSLEYYRSEIANYLQDGEPSCALDGQPIAV